MELRQGKSDESMTEFGEEVGWGGVRECKIWDGDEIIYRRELNCVSSGVNIY